MGNKHPRLRRSTVPRNISNQCAPCEQNGPTPCGDCSQNQSRSQEFTSICNLNLDKSTNSILTQYNLAVTSTLHRQSQPARVLPSEEAPRENVNLPSSRASGSSQVFSEPSEPSSTPPPTVVRRSQRRAAAKVTERPVPNAYLKALKLNRVSEKQNAKVPSNNWLILPFDQMVAIPRTGSNNPYREYLEHDLERDFPIMNYLESGPNRVHRKLSLFPKDNLFKSKLTLGDPGVSSLAIKYMKISKDKTAGKAPKSDCEVPQPCVLCQNVFFDSHALKMHMLNHSQEKTYFCDVCDKGYHYQSSLLRHQNLHVRRPAARDKTVLAVNRSLGQKHVKHKCKLCPKVFSRTSELKMHMKRHPAEKKFHCSVCKKSFPHFSALYRHKRLHGNNKKTKPFSSSKNQKPINSDSKPYRCKFCKKSLSNHNTLKSHMRLHTHAERFSCDICGKSYTRNYTLIQHKRLHGNRNTKYVNAKGPVRKAEVKKVKEEHFKCKLCSNAFSRNSYLVKHMLKHESEKRYVCDICGRSYTVLSSLKRHEKMHTNKRKLQRSSLTNKKTTTVYQKSKLKKAGKIKFQFKNDSCVCKVCSKTFKRRKPKQEGESYICRVCVARSPHTEVRKQFLVEGAVGDSVHNCEICVTTFPSLTAFKAHSKIHTDTSCWECKACKKEFKDSQQYSMHVKTHSAVDDQCHICPVCNRKYLNRNSMKRHVKTQHKAYPQDNL